MTIADQLAASHLYFFTLRVLQLLSFNINPLVFDRPLIIYTQYTNIPPPSKSSRLPPSKIHHHQNRLHSITRHPFFLCLHCPCSLPLRPYFLTSLPFSISSQPILLPHNHLLLFLPSPIPTKHSLGSKVVFLLFPSHTANQKSTTLEPVIVLDL